MLKLLWNDFLDLGLLISVMADTFIDFVNDINAYLIKSSSGIGIKYNIDYNLEDLKKIGVRKNSQGEDKGDPDIKFLKAYDYALAVKRNKDIVSKTPQDYYVAYNQECAERVSINNNIISDYLGASKA
jgi:hypothetical protein